MAAVGYSQLFGDSANITGSYVPIDNKAPIRSRSRQNVNRDQYRQITALFNALIGAVTGANVTATHNRVAGVNTSVSNTTAGEQEIGGARTIETFTDINRNTTAADVTALKEITFGVNRSADVRDLSGNGAK